MQKNSQHQGWVDLPTVQHPQSFLTRFWKKFIRTVSSKMLRRLISSAAFVTLLSVNIGGGAPVGQLNRLFAQPTAINLTDAEINTPWTPNWLPADQMGAGVYILYPDHVYRTQHVANGTYNLDNQYFLLNTANITLNSGTYKYLYGISVNRENLLNFDFGAKSVSVTNSKADAIETAGFDYFYDTPDKSEFSGTLTANGAGGSKISVTTESGNAYGFNFRNANLNNADIDLTGVTIEVTNSSVGGEAYGFVAGNITNNLTGKEIILGDITAKLTAMGNNVKGFVAGDVSPESLIKLGNVTAEVDGAGQNNGEIIAVELKKIEGTVEVTDITVTGQDNSPGGGSAVGFKAQSVLHTNSGNVTLGKVTVVETVNGDASGVLIGQIGGKFSVDDITATSNDNAIGFKVYNGTAKSNITQELQFKSITATATRGDAVGISLGNIANENYLGSVDAGKIILDGNITVESKNGGSAVGIYAGDIKGLDVDTIISAKSDKVAYGIWIRDPNNTKRNVINIENNAAIYASPTINPAVPPPTTASIRMDSTGNESDTVNIVAGIAGNEWKNFDGTDNQAFTLIGVETLNVTGVADLSLVADDSLRGRASSAAANSVATTNVLGTGSLTVKDSFFNAGTGKSNVNVTQTGKLEITGGDGIQNFVGGIIDTLTIKDNAVVTLGDKADLEFVNAANAISITDGKLQITDTAKIFATAQKDKYTNGTDLNAGQLEVTVTRGTIEVVASAAPQPLFAVGLKTFVDDYATIDVENATEIKIGDVTKLGVGADLIKDGAGTMTIDHNINGVPQKWSSQIDLGTGTLDIQAGTVQVLRDVEIKAATVNVDATFKTDALYGENVNVQINALTGGNTGEVNLAHADTTLSVKSGNFAGTVTGAGTLNKVTSGNQVDNTLTLTNTNPFAATNKVNIDVGTLALDRADNSNYTFNPELTGTGTLEVTLNNINNEFSFGTNVGNAFEGIVDFKTGKIKLGDFGGSQLEKATLELNDNTAEVTAAASVKTLKGNAAAKVDLPTAGTSDLTVGQGDFAGTITGAGTLTKDQGDVNNNVLVLTNDNPFTAAAGTKVVINKGILALHRAADSDYEFNQKLDGTGTLEVGLFNKDNKFSFGNDVKGDFEGTVHLRIGTIEFDDNNNENDETLAKATLELNENSVANVKSDTTIKNLTTNKGTVKFTTTEISPETLTVDTLDVTGGVTINIDGITTPMPIDTTTLATQSFFDYYKDAPSQQLIAATTVLGNGVVTLNPANNNPRQVREIHDGAGQQIGDAVFNYAAELNVGANKGISLGYHLIEIWAHENQTVTLDATNSAAAAPTLDAGLKGNGNFKFTGKDTQNVKVGGIYAVSEYTGTTEVTAPAAGAFTVTASTDEMFGKTSKLTVGEGAVVDFGNFWQTVGDDGLEGKGTIKIGTHLYVNQGANTAFDGTLTNGSTLAPDKLDNGFTKDGGGTLTLTGEVNLKERKIAVINGTLAFDNNATGNFAEVKNIVVDGANAILDLKADSEVKVFEVADKALTIKNNGTAKFDVSSQLVQDGWGAGHPEFNIEIEEGILELYRTNIPGGVDLDLTGVTTTVKTSAIVNVNTANDTFDLGVVKTDGNPANVAKTGAGTLRIMYDFDLQNGDLIVDQGTLEINPAQAAPVNNSLEIDANVKLNANKFVVGENTVQIKSVTINSLNGLIGSVTDIHRRDSLTIKNDSNYDGQFKATTAIPNAKAKLIIGDGNNPATVTLTHATPFTNAAGNDTKAENLQVQINDEATLALHRAANSDYQFDQKLDGTGTLEVGLNNKDYKFSFGNKVEDGFEGIVSLTRGTIELNAADDNETALKKATLKLAGDSVANVIGDTTIGNLTTNSGTVKFTTTEISPETLLTVTTLDVTGGVTINIDDIATPIDTPLANQSFFDYYKDAPTQQLIAATTVKEGGVVTLNPVEEDRQVRKIFDVANNKEVGDAVFNYAAKLNTVGANKGISLGYHLIEIWAHENQTVTLDATTSAAPPRLEAGLEGNGNFVFTGKNGQNVEVGGIYAVSEYTGTTEVTAAVNLAAGETFTVTALTDDMFGKTSKLIVGENAGEGTVVDFGNFGQTVGNDGLEGTGTIKIGTHLYVNQGATTTFDGTLTNGSNTPNNWNNGFTKDGVGTLTLTKVVELKERKIAVINGTLAFDNNSAGWQEVKNIVVDGADAILDLKPHSQVKVFEAANKNALTIKDGTARFDVSSHLVQDGWGGGVSPVFNIEIEEGTLELYRTDAAGPVDLDLTGVTTTVKTSATVNVSTANDTFNLGVVQTDNGDIAHVTKKGAGTLGIMYGFDLEDGDLIVEQGTLEINPDSLVDDSLEINANVKLNANEFVVGDNDAAAESVTINSLSGVIGSATDINEQDSLTIKNTSNYAGQFKATTAAQNNEAKLIIGDGDHAATVTLTHAKPFTNVDGTALSAEHLQVQIEENATLALHRAANNYQFDQKLDGMGTLEVELNNKDNKFSFGNSVEDDFEGIVSLTKGTIELDGNNNANQDALTNATLQLAENSVADVTENTAIGNLITNKGTVKFTTAVAAPPVILTVDTLDVRGSVTIDLSKNASIDVFDASPIITPAESLFNYDVNQKQQLIAATDVEGDDDDIKWVPPIADAQLREIRDANTLLGTAKFDYKATLETVGPDQGVYLDYGLTEIEANNNRTVILDATNADPLVNPPRLYAKLTQIDGEIGNFKFTGKDGQNVNVGNVNSNYIGKTEVTANPDGGTFTVTAKTDNAFGKTSELKVDATAKVVLTGQKQEVKGLAGLGEIELGELTVNTNLADSTFAGKLTGNDVNGSLTKDGDKTLTLSGENTYEGETKINVGTLALTGEGSIEESSKVTVGDNATFDVTTVAANTSIKNLQGGDASAKVILGIEGLSVKQGDFAGKISGAGALTKSNSGVAANTLRLSGENTYEGETKIDAGTLALVGPGSIATSSGVTLVTGTTFDVSGIDDKTSIKALNNATAADIGTVNLGAKELEVGTGLFAGTITGNGTFTKSNTGTLTLSNNNPFTLTTTTVNVTAGGTLILDRENYATDYDFNNKLIGNGKLEVKLDDKATKLTLGVNVENAFDGIVSLTQGTIVLNGAADNNVKALANATLQLAGDPDDRTIVNYSTAKVTKNSTIGNLITNGGVVEFDGAIAEILPDTDTVWLTVGDLDLSGEVTIKFNGAIENGVIVTPLADQSFFDYIDTDSIKIIAATNVTDGKVHLDPTAKLQTREIQHNAEKVGEATFDYNAGVQNNDGVYLKYGLKTIKADAAKTVELDATNANAATPTLSAQLTGDGGFKFVGNGKNVEVGNLASNYEGETFVTGTIIVNAVTNNAFGNTSLLNVDPNAKVVFDKTTQTVGGLEGNGEINIIDNGTLTLDRSGVTLAEYKLDNKLTGDGRLEVELDDKNETILLNNPNNTFSGTVSLTKGTIELAGADNLNARLLHNNNATLELATNESIVNVIKTSTISHLTTKGGIIAFTTNKISPDTLLTVNTLDIRDGVKISFPNSVAGAIEIPLADQNFFDYADNNPERLIAVDGDIKGNENNINFEPPKDTDQLRTIKDTNNANAEVGEATFGYTPDLIIDGTRDGNGVYLDYVLKIIKANDLQTVTLDATGSQKRTLSAQLTGTGHFKFTGNNTVTIGNENSNYTGTTEITGNNFTVIAGTNNAFGNNTSHTSELKVTDTTAKVVFDNTTQTVGGLTGNGSIELNNLGHLTVNATADSTFNGKLTTGLNAAASGSLTKTGSEKLTLSENNNEFIGDIEIKEGTLALTQKGSLATSRIFVSDTFDVSDNTITNNSTSVGYLYGNGSVELGDNELSVMEGSFDNNTESSFDGVISGNANGKLTIHNDLRLGGRNTYQGETTIKPDATLALTGAGSIAESNKVTVGNNATFDVSGVTTMTAVKNLQGSASAQVILGEEGLAVEEGNVAGNILNGTDNDENPIDGKLIKNGNGNLELSYANTYTGETIINAGTLMLKNSGRINDSSKVTVDGKFDVSAVTGNSPVVVKDLQGSATGEVTLGEKGLQVGKGNFAGTITGIGTFTKNTANTLILTNDTPFTGTSIVNIIDSGTLALKPVTNTNYEFDQKLEGDGTLAITLNATNDKFRLGNNTVGTEFTGTVRLEKGTMVFDNEIDNKNVTSLKTKTLELINDSVIEVTQNSTIGDLTANGGTVKFTNGIDTMLTVDELDITGNSGIKIDINGLGAANSIDTFIPSTPADPNFFDYANSSDEKQIIAATTVNGSNINLTNPPAATQQERKINTNNDEVGTAYFNYTTDLKTDGVYLTYGLTGIKAHSGKTVVLDATNANPNKIPTSLYTKLTGSGNFEFTGKDGQKIEVGNKAASNDPSDYTGTTTVTAKTGETFTLIAQSNNIFGNTSNLIAGTGTTIDFNGHSQTVGGLANDGVGVGGTIVLGDLTVDTKDNLSTFDGQLTGNGSLTKTGSNTLTLSGTNNYKGATTIEKGTLALTRTGSIEKSSEVALKTGGTFDITTVTPGIKTTINALNNITGTTGGTVTLGANELEIKNGSFTDGEINGTGNLTKINSEDPTKNTLTLSNVNLAYTGETNIKAGTLALTGNSSIANSSNVNVDGTLNINGIANTTAHLQGLTGNGNGKVELGNNNKELEVEKGTFYGNISGNGKLTKTGNGTLALYGTNTYTGATNINVGTLELTGTINSTSDINVANNAVLDVKGNKTINNLASAGDVTFNSALNLAGNKDTTINGLAGTETVTKTGTGITTLGNNTVGKFVQQNGDVVLAGTLTGDYQQQNTAGNFVAKATTGTTTTTIDGNAEFDANVKLESELDVNKDLTLNKNTTLNVDFIHFTNPTNAIIDVDGSATIDRNAKAIFNIDPWVPGTSSKTYHLLSANSLNGTFDQSNITVTFGNNPALNNNRLGYTVKNTITDLNLVTFTPNLAVTRSVGGQWSNPLWFGSDDNKFYNGDYVTLNGSGKLEMAVDSNVETAGMNITSGKWTFNGNSITGKTQTGYGADDPQFSNNNKGALTVTGSTTTAKFNTPIDFADIAVTGKAKLILPLDYHVNTGNLTVDKDAKLELQAVTNKVSATGDVTIDGDFQLLYDINPTQNKTISSIITTTGGIISGNFDPNISDKLLSSAKIQIVNQNQLDLVHTTYGVGDFAARNGLSGNIARIGDLINTQDPDSPLLQELYALGIDDQEEFERILRNHLSPELAADALQMNLWKPYLRIFNRLHETGNIYSNNINNVRGQNNSTTNYEFWFENYYRSEKISQDAFAGNYESSHPGMLIGMESRLPRSLRAGLFFGYGKPRVFNNIGRIEANDFTVGIYSRSQFGQKLFLNSFFAYGNQDYEYKHNNSRTSYGGEAIYSSFEFFQTLLRKDNSQLMPLVAVDFQKAWTDGFITNDTAQKIDKSSLDQVVLRIGMNSKFRPKEFLNFRTRLQYGALISGDKYGNVRTSFLNKPTESRVLTGVNLGRNMFNIGVGFDIYDSKFKNSRFFADYDFDLGERSTAHSGQLGIAIAW